MKKRRYKKERRYTLASLNIFKTRKWDMNNLFSHIGEAIIYIFYEKGYFIRYCMK